MAETKDKKETLIDYVWRIHANDVDLISPIEILQIISEYLEEKNDKTINHK